VKVAVLKNSYKLLYNEPDYRVCTAANDSLYLKNYSTTKTLHNYTKI